jgi:hypothetical protein
VLSTVSQDCDALSDAHFAHKWGPGVGDGGNASAAETVCCRASSHPHCHPRCPIAELTRGTPPSPTYDQVVAGLEGGCDQDCGSFYTMFGPEAAEAGLLRTRTLDTALERIFLMRIRLGEFDPLNPYDALGGADTDTAAHRDSALRAARESIVTTLFLLLPRGLSR